MKNIKNVIINEMKNKAKEEGLKGSELTTQLFILNKQEFDEFINIDLPQNFAYDIEEKENTYYLTIYYQVNLYEDIFIIWDEFQDISDKFNLVFKGKSKKYIGFQWFADDDKKINFYIKYEV